MNQTTFPTSTGSKTIQIVFCSVLISTFLVFNSCKKEVAEIVKNNYQDSTLLTFVKTNDLTIQELTYKDSGRIFELVEAYSYKKYVYNEKGKLVKIEQAMSFNPMSCFMPTGTALEADADPRKAKPTQYFSFEYDNSERLIKKSNFYLNSGTYNLTSYQSYEYERNVVSKTKLYNPLGILTQYQNYTYDDKGNNTRCDLFIIQEGSAKLIYSNIYEFDDKKNPFHVFAVEGIPGVFTNVNNIVKDTYIYYNATGQNQHITEYTYEYNAQGYPTKVDGHDYFYGK